MSRREYIVTRRLLVETDESTARDSNERWLARIMDITESERLVWYTREGSERACVNAATEKLREYGTARPADEPDPIRVALQDLIEKAQALNFHGATPAEVDLEYDLKESIQRAKEALK